MNKFTYQIGLVIASCLLVVSFPLYTIFWIYPHFTEIITFEKEVNAKQIAHHITKMLVLDSPDKTLARENITITFVDVLKEAQSDFDLTKVKIFSPQGEVLYSSDAHDIGSINTHPYFTDIVSQGKIFSMVVPRDEKTMEEEVTKKDVVETYVPLMRGQLFVGALEVYYDITYAEHTISKFIAKAKIIVLMLSLLLLFCILLLSLSAYMYLIKMRKTERKMQLLREKIPPLYNVSMDDIDE